MARENTDSGERTGMTLGSKILFWAMIVAVLIGGLGFVYKLVQFARESMGEAGSAFAVPLLVYATMAAGFACLLGWAALRGMFHDIERPKYRMLEREKEHDRDGN